MGKGMMSDATGMTGIQVPLFERFDVTDVRALVEGYPLAWVCGGPAAALESSLLPLVGVFDDAGRLVELIGHLMRSNPLHGALRDDPRATILFSGPQAYVSPEHAGRRNWAPTWNYAQVTIGAEIAFDSALTEHALKVLIDAMEARRAAPWGVEELGPRYHAMLEQIIGFRARVTSVSGKFKLGQDEDDATLGAILDALPDGEMTAWMRRFNPGR
ncbi:FMN-binding negative transcriptional regulator [Sphingomonas sp.]|uniref:FMN-binding negative transcriptional regulator n=1 Tax=Sphingomonas sp. TaxID=28214 RepID=UPI003BACC245